MKLRLLSGRALQSCAVTLLVVALAPAVLLFGEAVSRRHWRRRPRRPPYSPGVRLWVARPGGPGRGRGGGGAPGAGGGEPRPPRPDPPAGAMALPEPRELG